MTEAKNMNKVIKIQKSLLFIAREGKIDLNPSLLLHKLLGAERQRQEDAFSQSDIPNL